MLSILHDMLFGPSLKQPSDEYEEEESLKNFAKIIRG